MARYASGLAGLTVTPSRPQHPLELQGALA
jgi:hypothetical protein